MIPHIQFETRAVEDRNATLESDSGIIVYKDVDYVLVTPQGNSLTVEKEALQWLSEKRTDVNYEHFKRVYDAWKSGQELPVHGTAIKMCPIFTPAEVKQINAAGIRSVEDLAEANEDMLRRTGMGARALKQKAVSWVASAADNGKAAQSISALTLEVENLKTELAEKDELIGILQSQLRESEDIKPRKAKGSKHSDAA